MAMMIARIAKMERVESTKRLRPIFWVNDGFGVRVATSGRLQQQYRVPPDLVRALPVGEAVVIQGGRWAHVAVAQSSSVAPDCSNQ